MSAHEASVEVSSLSHAYGATQALRAVSFKLTAGEICGYVGPNGAGKSTTLKILSGLIRPASGTVRVCGFDVARDPVEVKARIGYVPESGAVYSTLTVLEFLSLVGELHGIPEGESRERLDHWLGLFGLVEASHAMLGSLSKGMRQRAVLVSALLHDPQVLLFDEPLTGLDVQAARVVKATLAGMARAGKVVLFSSHVLEVVERICGRIIMLDLGRIVLDEQACALRRRAGEAGLESLFQSLIGPS
ncbi:MAG: ABC transporter ATP-binding protein [Elusimicrobia bacterium]|nr:ABC transporter ATP-binding protein [Elusimicrobiota bacterium]